MADLRCYNKGCPQKTFKEEENTDDACRHHPGGPVFHEGYKFWSCCDNRKFTDFTAFLDHPGCSYGRHSNEKPPEPEKPKVEPLAKGEIIQVNTAEPAGQRQPVKERGPNNRSGKPLVDVQLTVTSSLKKALEKDVVAAPTEGSGADAPVKEGDPCHHNACKARYPSNEPCKHHPGSPIFHEGLKFWSCCDRKKMTDFEDFLALPGCTEGEHLWIKPKEERLEHKPCRHDFFQTGQDAVLTVFAKKIRPDSTSVKVNENVLSLSLVYENNRAFALDLHLAGFVIPEECSATLYSTKLELKLRKADAVGWSGLEHE